jgi:hypothetical protein
MHAISGPSVSTMLPSQQVLLLEESTAQCVTAALALELISRTVQYTNIKMEHPWTSTDHFLGKPWETHGPHMLH